MHKLVCMALGTSVWTAQTLYSWLFQTVRLLESETLLYWIFKEKFFFPLIIEKWLISNDEKKIVHELAAGTTIVDS